MYLLFVIITIVTLGILYYIDSYYGSESFRSERLPSIDPLVIPTPAFKKPPTPYVPYIRFGDKRKKFFVTDNK